MLVYCKSCNRTYDGNAQCCYEMDHIMLPDEDEDEDQLDFEQMSRNIENEE